MQEKKSLILLPSSQKKKFSKRKLTGFFRKILFLFFIFLGSFIALVCIFFVVKHPLSIVNPLSKTSDSTEFSDMGNSVEKITDLLKKNNIETTSVVNASESAVLATLPDGQEVVFSRDKDLNQQITSLQLILSRLTIEGKRVNRIDLRFANPVVSF